MMIGIKGGIKMKYFLILIVSIVLVLGLVGFVSSQAHEPGTGLENPELKMAAQGTGQGLVDGEVSLNRGIRSKEGNYTGEGGQKMQVQQKSNNRMRLEVGGVGVDCDCNLTQEQFQNRTKLFVGLSNGRNAEIKVMPNVASETALQRLRLKTCNEEDGCLIELKEVGNGNESKLVYEMNTKRQSKVLGLFNTKMRVGSQIDAQTGEVVKVNKPWWSFLATEPEEEF